MNLILVFPDDCVAERRFRLRGRRLRHVLEVHRAAAGDELRVGVLNGLMGKGLVLSLDDRSLEMELKLDSPPPAPLPATLILALPRPKVLRRVLASVSSLGVKRIILLNAYRVEKSFWQSPVLQQENVRRQLVLGLEQARDTVLPEVIMRRKFRPFVEDELPGIIKGTLPLVAHPGSAEPCPAGIDLPATVVIGPEGGFIPYELEKLVSCGFRAVQIGQRILAVETAVPFILSRLFH